MLNLKDHKTGYLFDPWSFLGEKRRKMMDRSWAGLFREQILNELPVQELSKHYDTARGRPTKELFTMLGAVLLQQTFNLTDDQTVEHLAFDLMWHYALDVADESDDAKYMCQKTLWSMRRLCSQGNIDREIFNAVTAKLAEVFGVELDKQRLDSTHLHSNMRRLSHLGVFVEAISKFLKNLKRQHQQLFKTLPKKLRERYTKKKSLACFAKVKPSDSKKNLKLVAADLYHLVESFGENKQINSMSSYRLLVRVLADRCELSGPDDHGLFEPALKPLKEIAADSLQNPSDPDAGYDSHKGQGYQAQVMETYTETEDPNEKALELNLITFIAAESAAEHDANALGPAIDSAAERGLAPSTILADSHYGSDENCESAKDQGVTVVAPVIGGGRLNDGLHLSDFKFSEDLVVQSCPAGHAPLNLKKNPQRDSAAFDARLCRACPLADQCPVDDRGSRRRYLRYTRSEVRISLRRAYEQTDEFKEVYRWRAGVEAAMSELDRLTGVKRLRVRGLVAVRYCVTLKACGLNVLRASRARRARIVAGSGLLGLISFVFGPKFFIKELFGVFWSRVELNFFQPNPKSTPRANRRRHLLMEAA